MCTQLHPMLFIVCQWQYNTHTHTHTVCFRKPCTRSSLFSGGRYTYALCKTLCCIYLCAYNSVTVCQCVCIACILLSITEPAKLTHFERQNIESDRNRVKKVVLMCVASGVPPPEITWHNSKSSQAIKAEKTIDTAGNYTSRLILSDGQDVEEYSCAVKNKYSETIWHSFAAPTASELI